MFCPDVPCLSAIILISKIHAGLIMILSPLIFSSPLRFLRFVQTKWNIYSFSFYDFDDTMYYIFLKMEVRGAAQRDCLLHGLLPLRLCWKSGWVRWLSCRFPGWWVQTLNLCYLVTLTWSHPGQSYQYKSKNQRVNQVALTACFQAQSPNIMSWKWCWLSLLYSWYGA